MEINENTDVAYTGAGRSEERILKTLICGCKSPRHPDPLIPNWDDVCLDCKKPIGEGVKGTTTMPEDRSCSCEDNADCTFINEGVHYVRPARDELPQGEWITTTAVSKGVISETTCGDYKQHPTEEKYPNQCSTFRELIENSYKIHLKKNQDYSPANITMTGEIGVLVRLWDKFCRILNLKGIPFPCVGPEIKDLKEKIQDRINHPDIPTHSRECLIQVRNELEGIYEKSEFDFSKAKDQDPAVKDEALEDTWLDLMTYAIIGNIARRGHWGR